MLRFHIKLIHPKLQWKSLAWLIIQKKKHIGFADSHIFFRVHLHLKKIPFASGLAQKQPPAAPNTIHDKRRRALFAEVQQSFFFPSVKTLTTVWTKKNKDIFEPSDWQSAGSSVSRSLSQWNHRVQVIVLFVARTSAKVTFTSDMQAEQMQPTLRSSSFWTMQLTDTHSTTCDESQKEMMNWFAQQLLTHLYGFRRKVYNSFYSSCNNATLKKKQKTSLYRTTASQLNM